MPLDLKSQERFLNFPAHPAIGAVQKKRSGKLHRDGAGAFDDAVREKIFPCRAGHAREIHPPMLLEVLILGGQNRIFQNLWVLFIGEKDAALQGEVADHLAVVRVEFGDHVGLEIFEGANLREIAGINKQQARQAAYGNRGQQQQGKSDTTDNLATAQAERDRRKLYHESFILTQTRDVDARIRKILYPDVS